MEKKDYAVVGYPNSRNLGDEIQSIAAARLLPRVDRYLPREGLDEVTSERPLKLLCNGFFMYQPAHWPPSKAIDPLFISLHVSNQNHAQSMADPGLKDYYQQFGPIGARDKGTERLFRENGHEAEFSACVTLTLENKFKDQQRTNEILVVDPFYKYKDEGYSDYLVNSLIPKSEHHRIVRISHSLAPDHPYSESEKIKIAEDLLDRYARASLVITSRIHCALPCLGLETPVLWIDCGYDVAHGRERFEGIVDFFTVVDGHNFPINSRKKIHHWLRRLGAYRLFKIKPIAIDFANPPANKKLHEPYAKAIRERVNKWLTS